MGFEALESRIALATNIWTGNAGNGLWSDNLNWNIPLAANNDLIFPDGAASLTNTNDLPAGTAFASVTVSGTGYAIGGAAINLSGLLDASQAAGTDTVNLPINFTGPATVKVDQSGAVLVLGGVLSGSGGLSKQGAGELDLQAGNAYTGTTTVTGGVLAVNGAQGGSPVAVNTGTSLRGSGTVGAITSTGGTVSPGGTAPAILTDTGSLGLDAASTFAVSLNGTTAGTGYSQLGVAGQVNLGGATLQTSLGYTPGDHDQLMILNNTGSAAINGTFAQLPQGATVVVSNQAFQISYTGGDGNDVVLTHLLGTTTTVSAAPTSSTFGQSVILTATVAATGTGVPTGTVEFFSGTTSLGNATLTGGVATLNTTALPVGSDPVTAQYKGDANFASSTSPASPVTVAQATTTTTLNVAPTSSVFGQTVTLTATVAPVAPGAGSPTGGTVQFFNGATSLGSAPLTNGTAMLSTTALPLGSDSITAQFQGTASYAASTSPAVVATVTQASSTTALTSSPNPSSVGESTILTATVNSVTPSSGFPTGTVQFFNGGALLGTGTLSGGVATLSTSALPLGASTLTAQYLGDGNYTTSTSPPLTQTVSPASNTTLTTSATSIVYGQSISMTATVTGVASGSGIPTGNVIFMSGTTPLGTAALVNGVATLSSTTNPIPGGVNSITAQYQGDSNFGGSTSAPVTVTVAKANTTATLTNAPTPSGLGNQVTLTATITSSSASPVKPSGTVQFFDGSTMIGTATASNGVATLTTSSLTLGTHSITAQYQGDTNYNPSTSAAVTQTVNQASTTTLVAAPTTALFGQPVTLTANVTANTGSGVPTGTVEFFQGTISLGTGTLVNGVATLITSTNLPVGSNLVTARYGGDTNFGISSSSTVPVTVNKSNTNTALKVVPNPSGFSQEVTLTATVTAVGPGSGTPTGPVQFSIGTNVLGTANLVNGVATLTITTLPFGTSSITARYASDTNFRTSTSAAVTATVNQSNSAVTVTSSKLNPTAFEAVTLTAMVVASNSGTGAPTGTIQFFSNGQFLGSGTLTNGVATLVTTGLSVGGNSVTAVYSGDSNFTTATSPSLSVTAGTQVEQFLNGVYVNATGLPATLDQLDFYRTQLSIGIPRNRVVTRIVNSHNGQVNAVNTVYRTFLRREATNREVLRGLTQVGKTQGFAVEIQVLGSREYYQSQGGGTIDGFVTALYQDVLGTAIPDSARTRLTQQLRQGASRASVASSLVLSQQGKAAFVAFLYQPFFGTSPTPQQSARSVGILNQGGRVNQVVIDLLASDMFFNQFATNS